MKLNPSFPIRPCAASHEGLLYSRIERYIVVHKRHDASQARTLPSENHFCFSHPPCTISLLCSCFFLSYPPPEAVVKIAEIAVWRNFTTFHSIRFQWRKISHPIRFPAPRRSPLPTADCTNVRRVGAFFCRVGKIGNFCYRQFSLNAGFWLLVL